MSYFNIRTYINGLQTSHTNERRFPFLLSLAHLSCAHILHSLQRLMFSMNVPSHRKLYQSSSLASRTMSFDVEAFDLPVFYCLCCILPLSSCPDASYMGWVRIAASFSPRRHCLWKRTNFLKWFMKRRWRSW